VRRPTKGASCADAVMGDGATPDKAGTEKGGNYTAGVLMHHLKDGRFVISHIVR
jgi:hypothetical protein